MENIGQPQALIFDMDGLMVDSEPLWFRVEQEFAEHRSIPWSTELAEQCVGRGLPKTVETILRAGGRDESVEDGTREIVDRFLRRTDELELKPGCLAILDAASGLPLAVASSSPRRLVTRVLQQFDLEKRFGPIVTGDDVTHLKPAPDIFLETARQLAIQPDGCVVLEDSLAGVQAARAAGMRVIAVPEHAPPPPAYAENTAYVVPSLVEARALLTLPR